MFYNGKKVQGNNEPIEKNMENIAIMNVCQIQMLSWEKNIFCRSLLNCSYINVGTFRRAPKGTTVEWVFPLEKILYSTVQ